MLARSCLLVVVVAVVVAAVAKVLGVRRRPRGTTGSLDLRSNCGGDGGGEKKCRSTVVAVVEAAVEGAKSSIGSLATLCVAAAIASGSMLIVVTYRCSKVVDIAKSFRFVAAQQISNYRRSSAWKRQIDAFGHLA